MKPTTKHVELDMHQATTVASVRDDSGRIIARTILPTDELALGNFFRRMRGTIHVAFEEGTQAQWLHDLLVPLVARVVACDRRGERRQGNKGDQVDADELSAQLRQGSLRPVYHGSPERHTLQELARSYRNLVEDSTRVMLRLKALFRAGGSGRRACGYRPWRLAGAVSGPGRAPAGGGALHRARRAAPAASPGEGGVADRRPTGSGVDGAADHSLLWPGAGGPAAGHAGYAVAVPDEAEPPELCGPRRGDEDQRRVTPWSTAGQCAGAGRR